MKYIIKISYELIAKPNNRKPFDPYYFYSDKNKLEIEKIEINSDSFEKAKEKYIDVLRDWTHKITEKNIHLYLKMKNFI
jgi:hypothetical protein